MFYLFIVLVLALFIWIIIEDDKKYRKILIEDLHRTYMYNTYIVRKITNDIPEEYKCFKNIVYNLSKQSENRTSEEFIDYLANNTKKVDNTLKEKLFDEITSILASSNKDLEMVVVWYLTTGILINNIQENQKTIKVEKQLEKIDKNKFNKSSFDNLCVV